MRNLFLRSSFLLLLLFTLATLKGRAQSLNWPEAESYGILSGNDVQANNLISVQGSAGAANNISSNIGVTGNFYDYNSGNVFFALGELQNNINYCSSLSGNQIDNSLSGQVLTGGIYTIYSNGILSNESSLELQGDSNTVFIFNVSGDLSIDPQAIIKIGNVRPGNIYWNVSGNIYINDMAVVYGIFMSQNGITKDGSNFGMASLLALQGSVDVNLDDAYSVGHNMFYSIAALKAGPGNPNTPFAVCPLPGAITNASKNMVMNGNFEERTDCGINGNILPPLTNPVNPLATPVCHWYSPNALGTPDYENTCNNPGTTSTSIPGNGVPHSALGYQFSYNQVTGSSSSGYTGINCWRDNISGLGGPDYREYLHQALPLVRPFKASRQYYGEFYAVLAERSGRAVSDLGMYVSDSTPTFNDPTNPTVLTFPANQPGLIRNLTGPIRDTTNWTKISGVFTATGTEKYITIGHFGTGAVSSGITVSSPLIRNAMSYYFIDGVAIYEIPYAGENIFLTDCNTTTSFQLGSGIALPTYLNPTYEWTADTEPGFTENTLFITVSPVRPTTYTLTVKANGVVIGTSSVSISGTIALGEPNQLTTITASAARFVGNVTFSGNYNILGPLELLYGDFTMEPGTVFNVEPENGIAPAAMGILELSPYLTQNGGNTFPTIIKLSHGAILSTFGATLKPSQCTTQGMWGGLHLTDGSRIYTNSGFDPNNGATYRTVIEQAYVGVASSQGVGNQADKNSNRYNLSNTDFIRNVYGFWDVAKHQAAFSDEGIIGCTFDSNEVGVFMEEPNPILNPVLQGGNYAAATYTDNTFDNNNIGFKGYANQLTLSVNTFNANNTSIDFNADGTINSSLIEANVIYLGNNGTGMNISGGVKAFGNVIIATLPQQGLGIRMNYSTTAENNTLNYLGVGIEVGTNIYDLVKIEKNTFTDNLTGIRFTPPNPGVTNGGSVPPIIACNTFLAPNISSNTIGIHIPQGVQMVHPNYITSTNTNRLGSPNSLIYPYIPSGNYFEGTIDEPIVNDPANTQLKYYVFAQINTMDLNPSITSIPNVAITSTLIPVSQSPCVGGTNPPGVLNRVAGKLAFAKDGRESIEDFILAQSYPNPAEKETTIAYRLPDGAKTANIVIREIMTGKVISTFELKPSVTDGVLKLNLQQYRNGIYAYSIIIDDKIAGTKMMLIEK